MKTEGTQTHEPMSNLITIVLDVSSSHFNVSTENIHKNYIEKQKFLLLHENYYCLSISGHNFCWKSET